MVIVIVVLVLVVLALVVAALLVLARRVLVLVVIFLVVGALVVLALAVLVLLVLDLVGISPCLPNKLANIYLGLVNSYNSGGINPVDTHRESGLIDMYYFQKYVSQFICKECRNARTRGIVLQG